MNEPYYLAEHAGPALDNEKRVANFIRTSEEHLLLCRCEIILEELPEKVELCPLAAH